MKQGEEDRHFSDTVKNSWTSQTVKGELSEMDMLHRQQGALRTSWEVETCKDDTAWELYQ